MRVLVTGATGFLGGRCLPLLADSGFGVVGTGRRASARPDGFAFAALDLSDAATFDTLPQVDAVVHCAALSSPWGARADFERANVLATENLLAWAERTGVSRFVHISTPALYFERQDQFGVTEDKTLGPPINLYAETKVRAETLVAASPLTTTILRPRAIYGPGDTALLPRLEAAIAKGPLPLLNGGAAQTNLTHVDDVCLAILAALQSDPVAGPLNIAGEESVTLKSVVEQIAQARGLGLRWRTVPTPVVFAAARVLELGYRVLPLSGEPQFTRYSAGIFAYSLTLDTSKAAAALGWVVWITGAASIPEVAHR